MHGTGGVAAAFRCAGRTDPDMGNAFADPHRRMPPTDAIDGRVPAPVEHGAPPSDSPPATEGVNAEPFVDAAGGDAEVVGDATAASELLRVCGGPVLWVLR